MKARVSYSDSISVAKRRNNYTSKAGNSLSDFSSYLELEVPFLL